MPITSELDNINALESVGFDHNQAKTLARIIEKSHIDSHESLKEFISNKLELVEANLKAYVAESQRDSLYKLSGIITAIIGLAVAIIKLF